MDRRFVCTDCGTKWFVPASRADDPDLTDCGACHGPLIAFVAGDSRLAERRGAVERRPAE